MGWIRSTNACHFPTIRPFVSRGRCPILDVLPLQGAIPFKPESWGTQGVVHSVHFTLG